MDFRIDLPINEGKYNKESKVFVLMERCKGSHIYKLCG